MANKIGDYTLDIGWDSKQAIRGVDALEKKIKNLANVGSGGGLLGAPQRRSSGGFNAEGKRIELLRNTNAQMRSLSEAGRRLPKGERFKAQRQEIAHALISLRQYRTTMMSAGMTTRTEANSMSMALVKLTDKVQRTRNEANRLRTSLTFKDKVFKGLRGSIVSGTVAMLGFYTAVNAVKGAIGNAREFENLGIQYQAAFGSQELAGERLEFVKKTAMELGAPLMALSKGYAQLGTAARMSGLSVKDGEEIFLAAAEAAKVFGLSQEQTDGVIRAFTQMIGKQQVMAEELKLQLGDRFPPAMGLFAKSMGVSVKELTKLMENGEVTNEHLIAFGDTLRGDVRASGAYAKSLKTLDTAMHRFGNRLVLFSDAFTGGGLDDTLGDLIDMASMFMKESEPLMAALGTSISWVVNVAKLALYPFIQGLFGLIKGIGVMLNGIAKTSLVNKDDMDTLMGMEYVLRIVTGLAYDAYAGWILIFELFGKIKAEILSWTGMFDVIFNALGMGGWKVQQDVLMAQQQKDALSNNQNVNIYIDKNTPDNKIQQIGGGLFGMGSIPLSLLATGAN